MTTDSDYARRSAVHHSVDARIETAQTLAHHAVLPHPDDVKRLTNLYRAVGDVGEELGCGHSDIDGALALAQAVLQEWQEHRLELEAKCCCPLQTGTPVEHRIVSPYCEVHNI